MKLTRLVPLLFISICKPVLADWTEDLARITCIPEARYFAIDYKPLSSNTVSASGLRGKQFWNVWRKHGYYEASGLDYKCSLPDGKYKISSTRAAMRLSGMCGAAPRITLSISRNDVIILKNVIFGDDCLQEPSVVRFEASEPLNSVGTELNIELAIVQKPLSAPIIKSFFGPYGEYEKAIPIDTNKVAKYAEKRD